MELRAASSPVLADTSELRPSCKNSPSIFQLFEIFSKSAALSGGKPDAASGLWSSRVRKIHRLCRARHVENSAALRQLLCIWMQNQ